MYLGVFTQCRGCRYVLLTELLRERIDFSPEGKYAMSQENSTMIENKEALKREQERSSVKEPH